MDRSVEVLVVDHDTCNDESFTSLDLSEFSSLRELEVGDYCFTRVENVRIQGLNTLEIIWIGQKCFAETPDDSASGCFCVKDCKSLIELKIGCESFRYYSVCEIENLPSLEEIEIGESHAMNYNFYGSSLTLKSTEGGMAL